MPNIQTYTTETIPTIAVEILRTAAIEIIQIIEIKSPNKRSQNHPNSGLCISNYNNRSRDSSKNRNKNYQNISSNYSHLIEITPNIQIFQPQDLEIVFFIDSGAESNIVNISKCNEIRILPPKHLHSKMSRKLATAKAIV